jgi:hypothetical protein
MKKLIILIRTLRKFKLRRITATSFFIDDEIYLNLFYRQFNKNDYKETGIYPIVFVYINNKRYLIYYTDKNGVAVFNM